MNISAPEAQRLVREVLRMQAEGRSEAEIVTALLGMEAIRCDICGRTLSPGEFKKRPHTNRRAICPSVTCRNKANAERVAAHYQRQRATA